MVEFDIIFDNMLVIMHLEVIDSVFSISSGVYRAKLSAESLDKVRPIIKPVRDVIRVKEGWLKEFQGSPSEIGKHEGHLVRVIGINGIAVEKRDHEVIELSGFGTIKSIRFLCLSFLDRASQWQSCLVMSIIASARLEARLLRVLACSGSLGSCSSCRGSPRGRVSSQGCSSGSLGKVFSSKVLGAQV